MSRFTLSALMLALLWAQAPTYAADGYAIELGNGDDKTSLARIHAQWKWDKKWFAEGDWYLTGYWEATLGRWHSQDPGGKSLWDIGLSPVFRMKQHHQEAGLYFEGAIGGHLLSETRMNNRRIFGSSYNFGDHIGFGYTFGDKGRYDLGYRLQHLSNANIKAPNDGINFHEIRFGYTY